MGASSKNSQCSVATLGPQSFNVWESSVKHRFLCFDFYSVMDYKGAAFKGNIYGALHLLHLTELSLEEKSAKPAFPLNSTASIFYLSTIRKVFCFKIGMNAPAKLMTVVFLLSNLFL